MSYTCRILLTLGLLTLPTLSIAQNYEPQKKSEVKVNKLDVIYEEEEFKGIEIDQKDKKETETNIYSVPFLINQKHDKDMDEEMDEEELLYTLSDEGAESEDEILMAGFDTSIIHLPKLNPNDITEPIHINLENFSWPTPLEARPSSHYGPRRRRWHYGLDLAQKTGEPIYASFDGVVRISKYNSSYGNLIIIHHNNGLETYYAHLSKRHVNVGDIIKSGQTIGLCGNTGRSHGSHLHYEIRYMGNALNPENVVSTETHNVIDPMLTITADSFRKVTKKDNNSYYKGGSSTGWYRVRKGDTLGKIAHRNGTTISKICQLNGINRNKVLRPGERLKVSGSTAPEAKSSSKSTVKSSGNNTYHTVRRGETLGKIAASNGTTISKLCELNGISRNSVIREGQKLKVE